MKLPPFRPFFLQKPPPTPPVHPLQPAGGPRQHPLADSRGSASSLASFVPIPQKSDISPIQGATSLYALELLCTDGRGARALAI